MLIFYLGLLNFVTGIQPLRLNATIEGTQTSEWTHYQLEVNLPEGSEGTLRFKLESEPIIDGQLVLSENSNAVPVFNTKRTVVRASNVDYNAWKSGRNVHYITIPLSEISITNPIYIGIGRPSFENITVPFTLTTEYSEGPLCPNDCSGQGKCVHATCKCAKGFINYDCSMPALHLKEDKWYSIEVPVNTTEYAYFKLDDDEILTVNLKWHGPFSLLSLTWNGYSFEDLPSETNYYSQSLLPVNRESKSLVYDQEIMRGDKLYFAFINKDHPSGLLSVQIMVENESFDHYDPYDYYIIFIGICVVFLVGIIILLGVYGCKSDPIDISGPRSPALPQNYINENFTKTRYRDLQGEFQKTCIICLEQFCSKDKVRQLPCKHVFHAMCIEEWFKHNVFCCLCKREFTPSKGLNSTVDM